MTISNKVTRHAYRVLNLIAVIARFSYFVRTIAGKKGPGRIWIAVHRNKHIMHGIPGCCFRRIDV